MNNEEVIRRLAEIDLSIQEQLIVLSARTRSYPYPVHAPSSNIFVRLLRRVWKFC